MKKLEQETNTWKGKYEKAATTLKSIVENVCIAFLLSLAHLRVCREIIGHYFLLYLNV